MTSTDSSPEPFAADDPRRGVVEQGPDSGTAEGRYEFVDALCGVATPRGGRGGAKAVLANDTTKVVTFEFEEGDVLTEHATRHPVLIQVIRGRIHFDVQDDRIEMAPGQVIHLTPMLRHAVTALEPTTLTVTMLLPHA
ncbi:MAG: cupin domain-containing protein [Mobilicoccus sp.]|nr:cupin domain-containing protein [Mobilicoccus sp.]